MPDIDELILFAEHMIASGLCVAKMQAIAEKLRELKRLQEQANA